MGERSLELEDRRPYQRPDIRKRLGRPWKVFDLDLVRTLAGIGCTDEELAAALKTTTETIRKRKHDDPEFVEAYREGWADVRQSLRRLQLRWANRSVAMAILLGKQLLGQSDKTEFSTGIEGMAQDELSFGRSGGRPLVVMPGTSLEQIRAATGIEDDRNS